MALLLLSYHNRNVPALSTIEVSPGCSFTMPRKRSASSCVDSDSFSTDDRPWGCRILVSGMGRGEGAEPLPSLLAVEAAFHSRNTSSDRDSESPLPPLGFPRSEEHTSELQSRGHLVC